MPVPRRILIIKLSSLGDLMHALPVVAALHEAGPCEVDWVTQEEYVALVRTIQGIRRVVAFPRRRFRSRGAACLRELRRESYDVVLDLQGLLKSALLARMARARLRLGPAYAREGAHLFYHRQPAKSREARGHAVEELLDVVRLLGIAPGPSRFVWPLAPALRPEVKPHMALAPCSRWNTKNWGPLRMAEAARLVQARVGGTLYIVGGPEDAETSADMAQHLGPGCVNLAGQTDLPGLAAVLAGMDLLIGVDSGPLHMAAALGVPVCAVFGATDPARTGPYGAHTCVVTAQNLECRPCHSRVCSRGDLACLERLTPEIVAQEALRLYARKER